jgi:hypothetical protein
VAVTEAGARPRSVALALVLLAAALVLSVATTVIFLATFFRDPPPELAAEGGNPVLWVWLGVFAVILIALLAVPVVLLVAIARRKRWAVWVYLALIVLGSLPLRSDSRGDADWSAWWMAVSGLMWGLEAAAFVLLFRRPSRSWFGAGDRSGAGPGEWRPDPTGRHQHRYWDGSAWTAHVADDGQASEDPLDEPPQACP